MEQKRTTTVGLGVAPLHQPPETLTHPAKAAASASPPRESGGPAPTT